MGTLVAIFRTRKFGSSLMFGKKKYFSVLNVHVLLLVSSAK